MGNFPRLSFPYRDSSIPRQENVATWAGHILVLTCKALVRASQASHIPSDRPYYQSLGAELPSTRLVRAGPNERVPMPEDFELRGSGRAGGSLSHALHHCLEHVEIEGLSQERAGAEL